MNSFEGALHHFKHERSSIFRAFLKTLDLSEKGFIFPHVSVNPSPHSFAMDIRRQVISISM
jgi:hypothetical protein